MQHMSSDVATVTILVVRSIPDDTDTKPVATNRSFGWVYETDFKDAVQ